jgi:hypothetical protein
VRLTVHPLPRFGLACTEGSGSIRETGPGRITQMYCFWRSLGGACGECSEGRSRPTPLLLRSSCKRGASGAEEEGFEPSIPR